MKIATAKGYMFESIIGKLLESVGYTWQSNQSGYLEGRGANHQFDAIGMGSYANPFVNNIRLLAEAKYLSDKVDLPIVRNFVGALIDINESYNPKGESIAKKLLGNRETNCGVIFSNQDFTEDAIDYGYAHNIYLVSYKGNPVMQQIINKFEEMGKFIDFNKFNSKNKIKSQFHPVLYGEQGNSSRQIFKTIEHNNPELAAKIDEFGRLLQSTSSVLGFIGGSYPVHIMSEGGNLLPSLLRAIPQESNSVIQVGYHFEVLSDNLVFTFIYNGNQRAHFVLPRYLFPEDKIQSRNLVEEKEEYLKNITIPFLLPNGVLTVIRLQFNQDYI